MRSLLACAPALSRLPQRPALVFQHNDFLPGAAIGRAVRRAAHSADRVSCLSAAVAGELDPDGRGGERLRVIHPGVDTARFAHLAPPRDGEPDALLLGAIVGWKRPQLALEVVALAARELPGLRLTLAGEPVVSSGVDLLETLRERAERDDLRGRVTFAGRVGDVGEALGGASCLLHCADQEPFGLALVEALAAGRPVVAPAAGGPLEIVDESCGRLYPPGDARAAAAALVEVLADSAWLGQAGRERAQKHFSLERFRTEFRQLLEETAAP
jgi:glycosyltransferase involved in cell wall biosynthesis